MDTKYYTITIKPTQHPKPTTIPHTSRKTKSKSSVLSRILGETLHILTTHIAGSCTIVAVTALITVIALSISVLAFAQEPVMDANVSSPYAVEDIADALEAFGYETDKNVAASTVKDDPLPIIPDVTLYDPTIEETVDVPSVSYTEMDVPDIDSSQKCYMDYRTITYTGSKQWELQQEATTDEYGFRRYGDYYMIALGTYYTGYECGKLFRITLDSGVTFEAITGDIKDDRHTDALNQHRFGNIVEFIVDTDAMTNLARVMGDMSYSEGVDFSGNIAKIELIEEIDTTDAE